MDKSNNLITSVAFCFIVLLVGTMVKAQDTNSPSMNSPNAATSKAAKSIDGVTLISQNGITTFPVTITRPGSYRLSSNLTVPANTNGIVIQVDNVTIDLNGFSISGSGSGLGISGTANTNITIRNGTITNFSAGFDLPATNVTIDQIQTIGAPQPPPPQPPTTFVGIAVGINSIVTRSIATGYITGIITGSDALVAGNIASENQIGIRVTCPSNVVGNVATLNSQQGILQDNPVTCNVGGLEGQPCPCPLINNASNP